MRRSRSTRLLAVLFAACASSFVSAVEFSDPAGDVTSPNADIVAASATIIDGMLDLRVRFTAPPFQGDHTHSVNWHFDTDQDPFTSPFVGGGPYFGMDAFLSVHGPIGAFPGAFGIPGVDLCTNGSFDSATNTLRFLFPVSLVDDDGQFNYSIESTFGGSGGGNEQVPDFPSFFFNYLQPDSDEPPAMDAPSVCAPLSIDIVPGNSANIIGGRRTVAVAILSSDTLDATTQIQIHRLTFGATGEEFSLIDCRSGHRDVNSDGRHDLICDFDLAATGLERGDTAAHLKAVTTNPAVLIGLGSDTVRFVGRRGTFPQEP